MQNHPPPAPADLAKQVDVRVSDQFSIKAWIGTAAGCRKKADYARLNSDFEAAYIDYLKYCTIIIDLPKHRDWPQFNQRSDPQRYIEYLEMKQSIHECMTTVETIKAELLRRHTEYLTNKAAAGILSNKQSSNTSLLSNLPPVEKSLAGMRLANSNSNKGGNSSSSSGNTNTNSNLTNGTEIGRPMETPRQIDAEKLYSYFNRPSPPRILFVDLRPHEEFCAAHVYGASVVNIPPELLQSSKGQLGSEIESALPQNFHRKNFERRHEFDILIYFDAQSTSTAQNPLLETFVQAVLDFEFVKVLKRNPALLVGGWNAWRSVVSASGIRSSGTKMICSGDCDGIGDGAALMLSDDIGNKTVAERRQSETLRKLSFSESIYDNPFHNFAAVHVYSEPPTLYELPDKRNQQESAYPDKPFESLETAVQMPPDLSKPLPSIQPLSRPKQVEQPPLQPQPPVQQPLQPQPLQPKPLQPALQPLQPPLQPRQVQSQQMTVFNNPARPVIQLPSTWQSNTPLTGRGLIGICNLGNTCYMNSMLQCLIATRPLSSLFYDGSYRRMINTSNSMGTGGQLAQSFSSLITQVFREENGVAVSPSAFRNAVQRLLPQFRGTDQHDAQEFLAMLLDGLHEDLNQGIGVRGGQGLSMLEIPDWARPPPAGSKEEDDDEDSVPEMMAGQRAWLRYLLRNDSVVVQLFQGQLKSQLVCGTCGKCSTTYNPFMYLSVPIPAHSSSSTVRLADCFQEFFRDEQLDGQDAWRCPNCKVPRRATKRLSISKLPKILLVHLKRFSQNGIFRDKINTMVDFPVTDLDLFPYLTKSSQQLLLAYYQSSNNAAATPSQLPAGLPAKPPQKFDLYAISNHYGGLSGGHYTAYVRQMAARRWFHFDDTRVSELCVAGDAAAEQTQVKTRAAYSLFYVSWSAL